MSSLASLLCHHDSSTGRQWALAAAEAGYPRYPVRDLTPLRGLSSLRLYLSQEHSSRIRTLADHGEIAGRGDGVVSLVAGGGLLAITAPPDWFGAEYMSTSTVLSVSRDGGSSWSFPAIADTGLVEYLSVISIDDQSRLRMLQFEGDCMYDGTALQTIQLTSGKVASHTQISSDYQTHATIAGRWAYDTRDCDALLCALDTHAAARDDDYPDLEWMPVTGLPKEILDRADEDDELMSIATVYANGRVYAHHGEYIVRLRGTKATTAAKDIPKDVGFAVMDSSYRLLGLSDSGELVRWSARRGLRALRGQKLD